MVMATAEDQALLRPDDLRTDVEAAGDEAVRYRGGMQGAVPDVGDVTPGNSAQASRQSARSSFRTLPVRWVSDAPARFRQSGSYCTP